MFCLFNTIPYKNILNRHHIPAEEFVMVGNSLKSDILPVLEIGAKAVHVEYESEWAHEKVAESDLDGKEFARLKQINEIINWLQTV